MAEQERIPVAMRVRSHRARLREQGLRPVQIWVPDVRAPEFAIAARAQSAAIASSEAEADDQAFVDAISWDWGAEGTEDAASGGDAKEQRT